MCSSDLAGMPDGDYRLGEYTVQKCLGGVRLPDGTLAGSALTMDQALRNLVQRLGLPLPDAARLLGQVRGVYTVSEPLTRTDLAAWRAVLPRGARIAKERTRTGPP